MIYSILGLLASGHLDGRGVRTPRRKGRPNTRGCSPFSTPFHAPTWGSRHPKHHQHREEGEGTTDAQLVPGGGGEEGDATPDLLLKHTDAILAAYV